MYVYDRLSIDTRYKIFVDHFYAICNRCCPTRTKIFTFTKINKPWLDRVLIVFCKRKLVLYNLYKRGVVTWQFFENFRNELSNTIRRFKLNYFMEQFDKYTGWATKMYPLFESSITQ